MDAVVNNVSLFNVDRDIERALKEARNPRHLEYVSQYFKIRCPCGKKIKENIMFLKKVLNQPNIVGTVMIALLLGAGFVYAFAFDGFNVETVPGGEVEAWLAQADGGDSDPPGDCDCGNTDCHVTQDDGTVKKGCKAKKSDGSNPCKNNTRKYPCPATADCRGKGGGDHKCTDQGCPKLPKPNGQPGKIDVCKKSPKKTCKGKC